MRKNQRTILPVVFVASVVVGGIFAQQTARAQGHPAFSPPPPTGATMGQSSTPPSDVPTVTMSPDEALKFLQSQQAQQSGQAPGGAPPLPPAATTSSLPPPPAAPKEEKFVPSEVIMSLPQTERPMQQYAILRTSYGDIVIHLFNTEVRRTSKHFADLAKGDQEFIDVKTGKKVKRPFYNGLIFHKVVKGFFIQTGCPFGTGRGGPGDIATIKDEIIPKLHFDKPGVVAMAPARDTASGTATVRDTNGSQFFITLAPMPAWDGQFTIFGQVEDGLDVVQKISAAKVGPTDRPIKRIYVNSIDIVEGHSLADTVGAQAAAPTDGAPPAEAASPSANIPPDIPPAALPAAPSQTK